MSLDYRGALVSFDIRRHRDRTTKYNCCGLATVHRDRAAQAAHFVRGWPRHLLRDEVFQTSRTLHGAVLIDVSDRSYHRLHRESQHFTSCLR